MPRGIRINSTRSSFDRFHSLVVLAIALVFLVVIAETALNYLTFDAQVQCQMQRMEAVRKPLSADVQCVPAIMRQDTTTINVR